MFERDHEKQKKWHQSFILLLLLGMVAAVSLLVQFQLTRFKDRAVSFGASYSTKYAYWLGLDAHKTYLDMLDDLGVRKFRLPVYWDDVEKKSGVYDWNEIRWMLDEAGKRNAEVTVVIGMRVPRYPECHVPTWAKNLSPDTLHVQLMEYVKAGVTELDSHPALKRWQIENEPYFEYFGECPPFDEQKYLVEIDAVRALSRKPILVTTSGEFGSWFKEARLADTLGISLYRGAYLEKIGYFAYPIPPWYYALRYLGTKYFVREMLISELQIEPWLKADVINVPLENQLSIMSEAKVKSTVEFAKSTGFDEIWLWGIEWWYWLKQTHGISSYWESGKQLF